MNRHQSAQRSRPKVAIINTSLESIEILQKLLADAGLDTVSAYVTEFKRGERDLAAFFAEHQPDAVVYDIALPYVQNWKFFREQVLARHLLPEDRFIVTTANRTVLEVLVGPTSAFEMIGRPYDLANILAAVKQAVSAAS